MKVIPKFCVKCGAEIKPGSKYCSGCGTLIQLIETEEKNVVENNTVEKIAKGKNGIIITIAFVVVAIVLGSSLMKNSNDNKGNKEAENTYVEETIENKENTVGNLSAGEYQSMCSSMMMLPTEENSNSGGLAKTLAQLMVHSKVISEGSSYRPKDMSTGDIERLAYGIADYYSTSFDDAGGLIMNHIDYVQSSDVGGAELYSYIYDKAEYLELLSVFYDDITVEKFASDDRMYYDYGEYIGVMGADGEAWTYFDECDIKEDDHYILIHAACYEGNNAGGENIYLYTANILFEKTDKNDYGLQAVYVETDKYNYMDFAISYTATSELPSYKEKNYKASNLGDGDYTTPWVEGIEGTGVGEYVIIQLDQPRWIQEFVLCNGYQSSYELFEMNGRATQVYVDFGDGVEHVLNCMGNYYGEDEQSIYFDKLSLEKPVFTHKITVTIMSAEAGTKYSDTCISEIELH